MAVTKNVWDSIHAKQSKKDMPIIIHKKYFFMRSKSNYLLHEGHIKGTLFKYYRRMLHLFHYFKSLLIELIKFHKINKREITYAMDIRKIHKRDWKNSIFFTSTFFMVCEIDMFHMKCFFNRESKWPEADSVIVKWAQSPLFSLSLSLTP